MRLVAMLAILACLAGCAKHTISEEEMRAKEREIADANARLYRAGAPSSRE